MKYITPILLAGGLGKRLWPTSRKNYPKQFHKLVANKTLFQQSALRFVSTEFLKYNPPITITNSLFRFIVADQLQNVEIDTGPILIEPEPKNTAAAIIAGTIFAHEADQDSIIIVSPSDHVIPNNKYFNELIKIGLKAVENGNIVTFGVTPTYPETGYGYLQVKKNENKDIRQVLRFIEKPSETLAKQMLKEGVYLWNSGIFMFRAKDMLSAFINFENDILLNVQFSVKESIKDLDFIRLDPYKWKNIKNISIDYAIMEKVKNLVAIPFLSNWSDLGNWDSVWRETKKDSNGVVLSKNAFALECKNSLLRTEDERQNIVGLGLEGIVAIAMPDAVLVAHKNRSQDVKNVVDYLKKMNISQSEKFVKDHRPWGWFEILLVGESFQVKKIFVKPGSSLSLQSHKFRSEHWVVVEGVAKVTINNKKNIIEMGQSTYVPVGAIHRIENPGDKTTIIIEIQIGSYLGEDDIIRYEDKYFRN